MATVFSGDSQTTQGSDREQASSFAVSTTENNRLKLLEFHAPAIRRFVQRRVRDPEDAADLAQQTLCKACASLHTFRRGHLRAWLLTIARHLIIDYYRARNRGRFLDVTEPVLAETEPALRTDPETVQALCESRDRLRCWLECISRRLPLEEQVAVLLADLHGYRDKDSAVALDLSLPSFKRLLFSARDRLRQVSGGACTLASPPYAPGPGTETHRGAQDAQGIRHRDSAAASPHPCFPGNHHCVSEGIRCCSRSPKLIALHASLLDALRADLPFTK